MEEKTEILRQPKDRGKLFRMTAEEDEKLDTLIKLACEMEDISKPTLQEFIMYSIDCARERLRLVYAQRKR